jgi:hypothetical protein
MNTDNQFDIKMNTMIQLQSKHPTNSWIQDNCVIQDPELANIATHCDWCAEHPKIIGEKFCSDECGDKFYSDFVAKLVDEEEDAEEEEEEYYCESEYEEEEEEEEQPLREMNDVQIEKYVELIGRYPRDECSEWAMLYIGGAILRYSYCKFIQWGIEDQTVSNITITRATFDEVTFTNYVFDNVTFEECVFRDIVLNNTTFKNSKFIDCEMDSSIVPDESCEVINYTDYIDDDHCYSESDDDYEPDDDDDDDQRLLN